MSVKDEVIMAAASMEFHRSNPHFVQFSGCDEQSLAKYTGKLENLIANLMRVLIEEGLVSRTDTVDSAGFNDAYNEIKGLTVSQILFAPSYHLFRVQCSAVSAFSDNSFMVVFNIYEIVCQDLIKMGYWTGPAEFFEALENAYPDFPYLASQYINITWNRRNEITGNQ